MKGLGFNVAIFEGATGQFELFKHKGKSYSLTNKENWVSEIFIPWSIGNMIPITGKRKIKFGAFRYTAFDGNLIGTAKTPLPLSVSVKENFLCT